MRRLVATEYVTLDGVFEEPGPLVVSLLQPRLRRVQDRELSTADALLLGRLTYEGFAKAWPAMEGTRGLVDQLSYMLHPVVLGKGKKLFVDDVADKKLSLSGIEQMDSGVTVLTYLPAGA